MSVYDFDTVYPRTDSEKWMDMEPKFGATDLVPLWEADMDFMSAKPILDALIQRASDGIFGYVYKPASHDEAIVDWYGSRYGFQIESDWILHTPVIMAAVVIFLRLVTRPGDDIVIQTPIYYPFYSVVKGAGRTLVPNPMIYSDSDGKYEMDLANLEESFKKGARVFILCSPHNPGGRVWTAAELKAVGELCQRYDVMVIADEAHADLGLGNHRFVAYASLGPEYADKSMTVLSPGKTFNLAGIQQTIVIIPDPKLRSLFARETRIHEIDQANCFSTVAVEAAYRHGGDWLDQALAYIQNNITYACDFIGERIAGIRAHMLEGTYLMWLDCRGLNMNGQELELFMSREARVAMCSGYWFGPEGEGFERLAVASPRAMLTDALERIEGAVSRIRDSEGAPLGAMWLGR